MRRRLDREEREILKMQKDIESMLTEEELKFFGRYVRMDVLQEIFDRYRTVPRPTFKIWIKAFLEGLSSAYGGQKMPDGDTKFK